MSKTFYFTIWLIIANILFINQIFANADYKISNKTSATKNHTIQISFGSFRNSYFYPMTNLGYQYEIINKHRFRTSANLRSYGTLFFFTKSAYDISQLTELNILHKKSNSLGLFLGLGIDCRLRLVKDERSTARSGVEPIISIVPEFQNEHILFRIPFQTAFYSNGLALRIIPEFGYNINKVWQLYISYGMSYYTIYQTKANEWRRDSFLGVRMRF
ncbi:MAG: hypothetical protein IPO21_10485 [Bacteroidales bacterium]|nr:hypothetical protein [Bacteroidales bacterium]